jgi:hypothetical protein
MASIGSVTANLTLQMQGLVSGVAQPLVTRIPPPFVFNSSTDAVFSGYLTVTASTTSPQTIFSLSGAPYASFLYVRNASTNSEIEIFVTFPSSLTSPTGIALYQGGWFLHGNPNVNTPFNASNTAGVKILTAGIVAGSAACPVEYMYAI